MSFLKRFSGLQWKLTISYVGVTLLTVLALETIAILAVDWFGPWISDVWGRRAALRQAEHIAESVADAIENKSPERLTKALDQSTGLVLRIVTGESAEPANERGRWNDVAHVAIGTQGYVIASNQAGRYPGGHRFSEPGLPEAERAVSEALTGDVTASYFVEELGVIITAVPLTDDEGAKLGVLYSRQPTLDVAGLSLRDLWRPLLVTTAVLLACMIPLGLLFGSATATGFTRRLRRLTQASHAMAGGDQSSRVHDPSGDEIGQLGRQFNAMAGRIQADTAQLCELAERNAQLAQQAQRLAALEERHRLACDLHDGVKQHLFGLNLTTASALNLLDSDPEAAQAKLLEAREHSRRAQAEMQALLDELRPAGLDDRGLAAALADYIATYERRAGIEVQWHPPEGLVLPLTHEQALFRIVQEALVNIARHAQARQVTVELTATPRDIALRVTDDGQGFDPSAVEQEGTVGLQGMRQRVVGLGGTFVLDTAPGKGTRITASLPLPTADDGDL